MMLVDKGAAHQLCRRHRPGRVASQRHRVPRRVVRQRRCVIAHHLGTRELGKAGLGAVVAALVHAGGLGLGHVGFVSLGLLLGAPLADEDGEGE